MRILLLIEYIILCALNYYDATSTIFILKHGGKEMNPILRFLFQYFPVEPTLISLKIALMAFLGFMLIRFLQQPYINLREKVSAVSLMAIANLFYIIVMYNFNYKIAIMIERGL